MSNTKTKTAYPLDTVNDYIVKGRGMDVIHQVTEDDRYDGRSITLRGKPHLNLSNCSYLGLELDQRLRDAAKHYIDQYGVQFSSSRAYLKSGLYNEWEELLEEIFKAKVITFTSVSIGHHAVIPVVVEPGDAIILDQQVHASVQDAAKKMLLQGVHVEPVRHNDMKALENKIIALNNSHGKIWYMADGVYSMYGDFAPIKAMQQLQKRYPKLHLYIDDAHGMSVSGPNGAGIVYNQTSSFERMILSTSLNKAFAAGGGVFVCYDKEMHERVLNCGGPYIFSGGHQIPVIGAGIASARIHVSNEIIELQEQLREKLHYTHRLLTERNLPVLSNPDAPIFFVGVGLVDTTLNMVQRLHADGVFLNPAIFPAVPDQSSGLRFTITNHIKKTDIEHIIDRVAEHFPKTFQDLGRSQKDIRRGFRKIKAFDKLIDGIPANISSNAGFDIQYETTIHNISKELWNDHIGVIGANDWDQLAFFENVFSNNRDPEQNWNFHYFIIRSKNSDIVLMTFFTETVVKDDMFAPGQISKQLEAQRQLRSDKYYMSSRTLTMGCLLSVGQHIYLDREKADWQKAFITLLDRVQELRDELNIPVLSLRDFDTHDYEIKDFLIEQGLKRVEIPDGHILPYSNWTTKESFIAQLKGNNSKSTADRKNYIKKRVFANEDRYNVRLINDASKEQIDHYYKLYMNVSDKNYDIVGYSLTPEFFKAAIEHDKWELLALDLKSAYTDSDQAKTVGFALSYRTNGLYSFLVTGIDYDHLEEHQVYPQILWQTVVRANALKSKLNMGITASQPKRKFGAELVKSSIYVQNKDTLKDVLVGLLANQKIVA